MAKKRDTTAFLSDFREQAKKRRETLTKRRETLMLKTSVIAADVAGIDRELLEIEKVLEPKQHEEQVLTAE